MKTPVHLIIRKLREERGQALVELAFVIPLLLLFLFAIIDFGLALNTANTDTNIADYAVREAAVIGDNTTALCGTVTESSLSAWALCETSVSSSGTPSVCILDLTSGTNTYTIGDALEVKVNSVFNWSSILTNGDGYIGKLSPSSSIGSSATMRLEDSVSSTANYGTNSFLSNSACT